MLLRRLNALGAGRIAYKNCSASVVYTEEGKCWVYNPDLEPEEPCLRPGLKGNPYGNKKKGGKTVYNRTLYRPPLHHPVWKSVENELNKLEAPNFLNFDIPAVLPDFPMEAKKLNPHYVPGKYPTIRNAYFEQQQKQKLQKEAEIQVINEANHKYKLEKHKYKRKRDAAIQSTISKIQNERRSLEKIQ